MTGEQRGQFAVSLLLGAACLTVGCERRSSARTDEALSGTVVTLNVETGELTLRPDRSAASPRTMTRVCVVTKHAEIYVNDRLSGLEDVRVGDTVDLLGYRSAGPDAQQFVVSFARINRDEPAPPAPDLEPPGPERAARTGG